MRQTYHWILGSLSYKDAKDGDCLKYGDIIFLQDFFRTFRWLTGARGSKNQIVQVRNHLKSDYEKKEDVTWTYQWIVRRTSGTGRRSYVDPAQGKCVQALDTIFLQNNYKDGRWLSGGRFAGGNNDVFTRNSFESDHETKGVIKKYQRIVRLSLGTGIRTDATTAANRPDVTYTSAPATSSSSASTSTTDTTPALSSSTTTSSSSASSSTATSQRPAYSKCRLRTRKL